MGIVHMVGGGDVMARNGCHHAVTVEREQPQASLFNKKRLHLGVNYDGVPAVGEARNGCPPLQRG